MLKKLFSFIFVGAPLIVFSLNTNANVKTSSLTIAKPSVQKNLPTECKKMFSVAEQLVVDAERQPGTHTQLAKMKRKLSLTKQQILNMDTNLQQKSCEKGLTALNTLKQRH